MSTPALSSAIAAGTIAAFAVAGQRIGLGLALALLLTVAAGALNARGRVCRVTLGLAGALATAPLILDAGWVVAIDIIAALVASAVAVSRPGTWPGVARSLVAPCRLLAGSTLVARSVRARRRDTPHPQTWAVARGLALAALLVVTFGALFAAADSAFADLLDGTFSFDLEPDDVFPRAVLALAFVAAAGALARRGATPSLDRPGEPRFVAGRTELRIALGALALLFATFVAVQVRVLFGGADYVRDTTGLGYGDYARQGFVQLLVVAALTLAVVAFAARQRDRAVRVLLGVLCVFTLVVLLSAHHRLDLVEDAYGFTRVRYAGHAIVLWLGLVFGLVLASGVQGGLRDRLPRVVVLMTLTGVLAFSISNPDARIADRAVDRALAGGTLDSAYLGGLSADALPAVERLPRRERDPILRSLREGLRRSDGLAGLNVSRARAR
jgi:hypothetical protein